ncbi:MAG: DUF3052 domain-containing protein, partial [Gemmatimonadetes bacterium]|nr:DUF3052 domain-containing protein [Gemmatimonadota bacterium]
GLAGAPPDFPETLGDVPEGCTLVDSGRGRCDLIIWFVRSRLDLDRGIDAMAHQAGDRPIWVAWPKQASGISTDVTQQMIREAGLGIGLVDYKICAIDSTWSGLLFRKRKA